MSKQEVLQTAADKPEVAVRRLVYCLGGDDQIRSGPIGGSKHLTRPISVYDPTTRRWTQVADWSPNREKFVGVAAGHRIYIVGGRFRAPDVYAVKVLDCLTNTWSSLPAESRCSQGYSQGYDSGTAVAYHGGSLYFSGCEALGYSETMLIRYDIETNNWQPLKMMNSKRCFHSVITVGDKIYAIGGNGHEELQQLWDDPEANVMLAEVYDIATDEWSPIANPNFFHRDGSSVCLHQGQIFVVSGSGLESYNPDTNEWTLHHAVSGDRTDPNYIVSRRLVSIDGRLLSLGGRMFEPFFRAIKMVFEFDFRSKRWIQKLNMDTERVYHGAFTVELPA